MGNSILNILTECMIWERIDSVLFQSVEYKEAQGNLQRIMEQMESHDFSEKERQLIEEMECAYALLGNVYFRLAYQQGFKDSASLLAEIGLIK